MGIVWGVRPPVVLREGWIHLLIPKHPLPYHIVVLGPVQGTWTHWTAKGTAPHTGEGCEHCPNRITWKGYAPVICWGQLWKKSAPGWHKWVLVVPRSAKEDVDACQGEGIFECRRSSEQQNSGLTIRPHKSKASLAPPPTEPFDVKPYVLRAWGYEPDFPCSLNVVG
jgi:hypothetical protein